MEGPNEGRLVHFVLPNGENRAALVVRVFANLGPEHDGMANLYVFLDGMNDRIHQTGAAVDAGGVAILWATSVHYSETPEPGTWHWIYPGQAGRNQAVREEEAAAE